MSEIVRADVWLYGVLSADATLTAAVSSEIHSYLAPSGTTFPYCLYAFQGGKDVSAIGGIRIMFPGVYQVKAVGQGNSMVGIEAIANRIDTLLHGATGTVSGGVILACVREQPLAYVENSNGIRYNHLGGLYRIIVQV